MGFKGLYAAMLSTPSLGITYDVRAYSELVLYDLSTPSLGITGAMSGLDLNRPPAFNSLSRDHGTVGTLHVHIEYNHFQLPLSGSQILLLLAQ